MDGGTEAAVFGLVRDPLAQLMDSLAQKSRGIDATLGRLDVLDPNWECFAAAYDGLGKRLSDFKSIRVSLNADRNHDNTKAHSSSAQELTADCIDQLLGELQQQLNAHSKLFEQLSREEESNKQDEDRIAARAKDFGPAIRLWLKFHARKGLVKNLLDTASSTR